MNRDFANALRGLRRKMAQPAIDKLADELAAKSSEADREVNKKVLAALGDAVRRNGDKGLDMAEEALGKILNGVPTKGFRFTSLRAGSDLLAELQSIEAKKRERVTGFIQAALRIIKKAVLAAV